MANWLVSIRVPQIPCLLCITYKHTGCISGNNVKYTRCYCTKDIGYWKTTGCPPALLRVVQCPKQIPKAGEICCALIEKKKSQYKLLYNEQSSESREAHNKKSIYDQVKDYNNKATHDKTPKSPKKKSRVFINKRGSVTRIFELFDG